MTPQSIYGWVKDGRAYLSRFPKTATFRPAKQYASRKEAEDEAKMRRKPIEWDDAGTD